MRAPQSIPAPARADRLRVVAAQRSLRARSAQPGGEEHVAERSYFVRRCLHTWAAAGGNVRSFFQRWTPLSLGWAPPLPSPRYSVLRGAAASRGVAGRRRGSQPAQVCSSMAREIVLTPEAAKVAALRRRFPYVAELLGALSDMDRGEPTRGAGNRRG